MQPKNNVDFEYLLFTISIRPDVGKLISGSTRPKLNQDTAAKIPIPLPPTLADQRRIAAKLREQLDAVSRARAAAEAQVEAAKALAAAYVRESLCTDETEDYVLGDCLVKVKQGAGADWRNYRLIGATREGVAPAKEGVGKQPDRASRGLASVVALHALQPRPVEDLAHGCAEPV